MFDIDSPLNLFIELVDDNITPIGEISTLEEYSKWSKLFSSQHG